MYVPLYNQESIDFDDFSINKFVPTTKFLLKKYPFAYLI